jgi:hypothetical protein
MRDINHGGFGECVVLNHIAVVGVRRHELQTQMICRRRQQPAEMVGTRRCLNAYLPDNQARYQPWRWSWQGRPRQNSSPFFLAAQSFIFLYATCGRSNINDLEDVEYLFS